MPLKAASENTRTTLKQIRQNAEQQANQLRQQADQILADADAWCELELFGTTLADQHDYPPKQTGLDSINYYLSLKLSLRPAEVQSFTLAEYKLALGPEMAKWQNPLASTLVSAN